MSKPVVATQRIDSTEENPAALRADGNQTRDRYSTDRFPSTDPQDVKPDRPARPRRAPARALCSNCGARPVSRKPHSVLCDPCTAAIYAAKPDDGFDLFENVKRNHGVKSW